MKIYHGSKKVISKPVVLGSNPHNDYGPSFYLTLDLEAAKSWACRNDSVGVVNEYEIKNSVFKKLKVLDLTNKNRYSVFNWLSILMYFRTLDSTFAKSNKYALEWLKKYYIDVKNYDVVVGFRADDSYFRFPIRFIANDLSLDDLEEVFLSGNLGVQYAFMSQKAIDSLKYISSKECEDQYLGHYHSIVMDATKRFDEILTREKDPNKKYILDLIREENE